MFNRFVSFTAIIYLLLLMAFCYLLLGIYYEEFTDIVFNVYLQGILTGKGSGLFSNYMYYTGLSWVYAFAYNTFPLVPWYGISLVAMLLVSLVLLVKFVKAPADKHTMLMLVTAILVFPFLAECLSLVQFTRVAFFTAAFPVLAFIAMRLNNITIKTKHLVLFNTILIWSILVRLETATLVGGIMVMLIFCIGQGPLQFIKQGLKAFWPSVVVLAVVWVVFNVDFTETDKEYRQIRAYTNTLWDFSQDATTLSLKNAEDSALYDAAANYFVNDKEKINAAFFERAGLKAKDKSPLALSTYAAEWELKKKNLQSFYSDLMTVNRVVVLAWGVIFSVSLLLAFSNKKAMGLITLNLFVWLMLTGIAVLLKMEDRILVPTLIILMCCNVVFLYAHVSAYTGRDITVLRLAIIPATGILLLHLFSLNKECTRRSQTSQYIKAANAYIAKKYAGKTILYNLWAYNLFYTGPLAPSQVQAGLKVSAVDIGLAYLLPVYSQHAQHVFGTATSVEIMKSILRQSDKFIFISDEKRMDVITGYFNKVYGLNIAYERLDDEELNKPYNYLNWYNTTFSIAAYKIVPKL